MGTYFDLARIETPTQTITKAHAQCDDDLLSVRTTRDEEVLAVEAHRESIDGRGDAFSYGEVQVFEMKGACACGGTRIEQKNPEHVH